MSRNRTYGQKIAAGFAVTVVLTLVLGGVATYALRYVVTSKDYVTSTYVRLLADAVRLDQMAERKSSALRGYLLTSEPRYLEQVREARTQFISTLNHLSDLLPSDDGRRQIAAIEQAEIEHQRA